MISTIKLNITRAEMIPKIKISNSQFLPTNLPTQKQAGFSLRYKQIPLFLHNKLIHFPFS